MIRNNLILGLASCFLCSATCKPKTDPKPPVVVVEPKVETPATAKVYTPASTDGGAVFDYWQHSPLHPKRAVPVTFRVKAAHEEGIERAELYVFTYQLYTNDEGLPSKKPLKTHYWGRVAAWDFSSQMDTVDLQHNFEAGFPDSTNVEYIFRIVDADGGVSDRLAIFDAGESPWSNDKILLYATSRDSLKHKINLCFFPDKDYAKDWDGFIKDAEKLVYEGYHQNQMMSKDRRHWSFYYTKQEMDSRKVIDALDAYRSGQLTADEMDRRAYAAMPSFVTEGGIQGIDAFGLLHKKPYSDVTFMQNGFFNFVLFNLFTSEPTSFGTAIHETSHAVFKLSDEYDQCSCFMHPFMSNIFSSMEACRQFNIANGFNPDDCNLIVSSERDWFKSERTPRFLTLELCQNFNAQQKHTKAVGCELVQMDDGLFYIPKHAQCIMENDGNTEVRQFSHTCSFVIDKYYKKLKKYANLAPPEQSLENMYGYEPVVLIAFNADDENDMGIQVKEVRYGVPTENFSQGNFVDLGFYSGSDLLHTMSLDDPAQMLIHHQTNKKQNTQERPFRSKAVVSVPFDERMERVDATPLVAMTNSIAPSETFTSKDTKKRHTNTSKTDKDNAKTTQPTVPPKSVPSNHTIKPIKTSFNIKQSIKQANKNFNKKIK